MGIWFRSLMVRGNEQLNRVEHFTDRNQLTRDIRDVSVSYSHICEVSFDKPVPIQS